MQFQAFGPLDQKNEIFGKRSLEKGILGGKKILGKKNEIFLFRRYHIEHVVTGNKELNDRSPPQR